MIERGYTYVMADELAHVVKVGRAVNVARRLKEHNFSQRQRSRGNIERIIRGPIRLELVAVFGASAVPEPKLIAHFKQKYVRVCPNHYEWFYWRGWEALRSDIDCMLGGAHGAH